VLEVPKMTKITKREAYRPEYSFSTIFIGDSRVAPRGEGGQLILAGARL
jgi:hypothetical protein